MKKELILSTWKFKFCDFKIYERNFITEDKKVSKKTHSYKEKKN